VNQLKKKKKTNTGRVGPCPSQVGPDSRICGPIINGPGWPIYKARSIGRDRGGAAHLTPLGKHDALKSTNPKHQRIEEVRPPTIRGFNQTDYTINK